MTNSDSFPVGIDDMAFYVPNLYLPISALAEKRELPYDKLNKGLGLYQMSVPDVHEDAATMAANSIASILDRNELDPRTIGRIYLGTESAWDGAKPVSSNVLEMLQTRYEAKFGKDCFVHCDVVDMTFACIAGVDALQNTIDWVKGSTDRIGLVVSTDVAQYDLGSTGEYTQGAGAVALLVRQNPRLLAFEDAWGVATEGVYDFYKPIRPVDKIELIEEVLRLSGMGHLDPYEIIDRLPKELEITGILDENDHYLFLSKDTPVFDGPYSNQCYQTRIRQALEHFRTQANRNGLISNGHSLLERWDRVIFHLPYAFQAKRMFTEIFFLEMERTAQAAQWLKVYDLVCPLAEDYENEEAFQEAYTRFLKAIAKTDEYRAFIQEKVEKGQRASSQVGNLYTASIFLSLMSTLEADLNDNSIASGRRIGFFGYGSGSKSKVFEAVLQPEWRSVVQQFALFETLDKRQEIDYDTYEKLHRGQPSHSIFPPQGSFSLIDVATDHNHIGTRTYEWVEKAVSVKA